MPRALADIMTELNSVYNPQRQTQQDIYNRGVNDVSPLEQADLSGLEQAKKDAFSQITTDANRRGMLFSGIPLEEQAKYTGSQYLPSVANLKNRYAQIRGNLLSALQTGLQGVDEAQSKYARDIYNTEVSQDIEREKIAAQERAARAAAAASSGAAPSFSINTGANTNAPKNNVAVNPNDQALYNRMFVKPDGSMWSNQDLLNDYNATLKSARYGNTGDQEKIRFYHAVRPDLFGSNLPTMTTQPIPSQLSATISQTSGKAPVAPTSTQSWLR